MSHTLNRRSLLAGAAALASARFASATPTAAQAAPILIGQSLPLSGPVAPALVPIVQGQNLALEQLNRKGGIHGRPVQLVQLDDAYDPRRTVENVQTLIERDKVVALTGLASTPGVAWRVSQNTTVAMAGAT